MYDDAEVQRYEAERSAVPADEADVLEDVTTSVQRHEVLEQLQTSLECVKAQLQHISETLGLHPRAGPH